MIYDCFSFFNELDLLEIRLNVLCPVVDKFILVESPYTHTGLPKPLYYAENKDRFSCFNDKIIHIVIEDFPSISDASVREMAWIRENWQRNAIVRALPKSPTSDDYVIISDLDEIPSPEAVKKAKCFSGVSHFYLEMFHYFVNFKNYSVPIWRGGPQGLPLSLLMSLPPPQDSDLIYPIDRRVNTGMTPTAIRFLKPKHTIKNAGWHFSYCGGVNAVIAKIKSIAHTENDTKENTLAQTVTDRITKGRAPYDSPDRFFAVSLDKSFPEFIRNNQARFQNLIFPVSNSYRIKTFFPKTMAAIQRTAIKIMRPLLPRGIKDWLYHKLLAESS